MLEVSSPGLERPVRWHRHWVRFVGREVQATVAGLGRVRARIVAVPDEATVVLEPQGARRGRCRWPEFATRVWRWIGDEEPMTTNTSDVVSAIRELTNTKQLERTELLDLLKDGLHAALVKRYGPNVRAEIGIDELKGTIRIAV